MLCHACLQMALHEEARAKKKARKIATSSGFASAVGPSRMLVAEKGSAVGNHCFCGSASLGCVLRFAISTGNRATKAQRRLGRAPSHGLSVPMQMRAILVRPRQLLITYQHAAASSPD